MYREVCCALSLTWGDQHTIYPTFCCASIELRNRTCDRIFGMIEMTGSHLDIGYPSSVVRRSLSYVKTDDTRATALSVCFQCYLLWIQPDHCFLLYLKYGVVLFPPA